jgi:hypothetical protein
MALVDLPEPPFSLPRTMTWARCSYDTLAEPLAETLAKIGTLHLCHAIMPARSSPSNTACYALWQD